MSAVLEVREPSRRSFDAVEPRLVQEFDLLARANGGVARLRQLILALAVRGKLVPQDPQDEPVEALVQRVCRARESGDLPVRDKRSVQTQSRATAEQPFPLPFGWRWSTLPDLCAIAGGSTPSKAVANNWTGDIPWVSPKDMKVRVIEDSVDHISASALTGSLSLIPSGSLLMVVRGMILAHSFPVAKTSAPVTINQDMKALTPYEPQLLPFLVLLCEGMKAEVLALVERSTHGTCKLESHKIFGLQVPLPPLAEQARIVARVDELMRLCDALDANGRIEAEQHARLLSTLLGALTDSSTPEELAANWQRVADHFDLLLDRPEAVDALEQTILQLAVRGLLVPQLSSDQSASSLLEQIQAGGVRKKAPGKKVGAVASEVRPHEVPFEVPDSWAWSRFGQIAEIASDLVQPAGHGSEWQVAPDCIEKGTGRLLAKRTVADADVKSANHRFHPGQIIYSKIRPSLSKAVIVDFAGLCSADMYPINAKISTQYLLLVILSRCFLDQVAAAENRVKMPKLNQEALTAFLVPVPPLAEQERIVARVAALRRLCTDLRQCLGRSSATQAALAEALIEYAQAA